MHYDSYAFSSNNQPTIVAKDGKPIDDKNTLSDLDIEALKRAYSSGIIAYCYKILLFLKFYIFLKIIKKEAENGCNSSMARNIL